MGKSIRDVGRAQEHALGSLSELIHQHVRVAIEMAVHEELRASGKRFGPRIRSAASRGVSKAGKNARLSAERERRRRAALQPRGERADQVAQDRRLAEDRHRAQPAHFSRSVMTFRVAPRCCPKRGGPDVPDLSCLRKIAPLHRATPQDIKARCGRRSRCSFAPLQVFRASRSDTTPLHYVARRVHRVTWFKRD